MCLHDPARGGSSVGVAGARQLQALVTMWAANTPAAGGAGLQRRPAAVTVLVSGSVAGAGVRQLSVWTHFKATLLPPGRSSVPSWVSGL